MQAWANLLEELDNLMYCAYVTLKEMNENTPGYQTALAQLARLYHSYTIVSFLMDMYKINAPYSMQIADMKAIKQTIGVPYCEEKSKTTGER